MITRKQYIQKVQIYKDSSLSHDWLIDGIYLFGIIPLYISKTKLS